MLQPCSTIPVSLGVGFGGEGEEELELAMRCGKVRRLHPITLNQDGTLTTEGEHAIEHWPIETNEYSLQTIELFDKLAIILTNALVIVSASGRNVGKFTEQLRCPHAENLRLFLCR